MQTAEDYGPLSQHLLPSPDNPRGAPATPCTAVAPPEEEEEEGFRRDEEARPLVKPREL